MGGAEGKRKDRGMGKGMTRKKGTYNDVNDIRR